MHVNFMIIILGIFLTLPGIISAKDITGTYTNKEGSITINKTDKKDIYKVIIKDKNGICQQKFCKYWESLASLSPVKNKGDRDEFDIFINTNNITIMNQLHPFDDPCQWSKEHLFFTKR